MSQAHPQVVSDARQRPGVAAQEGLVRHHQ
jgi:hypothetical protein